MKTTMGMRLHIGFFGKRNAGKSSLVNKISGQELSVVSEIKGTTTDVNQKAMELLPIGPVVLLDTAGIDDIGELGKKRIEKTKKALERCDIIVFVTDDEPLNILEKNFLTDLKTENRKILTIVNKIDKGEPDQNKIDFLNKNSDALLKTSTLRENNGDFTKEFKNALVQILPDDFINNKKIMADLIKTGDTVVLVIPIDKEAPKGRIILPQANTLREGLDIGATSVVTTVDGLKSAIENLKTPPKIVITDSQAFKKADEITPESIPLTSFSILFARMKGDLNAFVQGAKKLDEIKDGDKILILESCTHHPVEDDIGRVKIPNLIKKYTGQTPIFEHFSGHDMPENLDGFSLIIHCGGCMTNRREILNRIKRANALNIPITNYGIAIAKCLNILERAIKPFAI